LGADVVEVDVRDEDFPLPKDVDLAFLTIHGTFGEDGTLQKILEGPRRFLHRRGRRRKPAAFDKI
jgi:D-alanine-D-alanine ligase